MKSHEPGLNAEGTNDYPLKKKLVALLVCILQLESISDIVDVCTDVAALISVGRSQFSTVSHLHEFTRLLVEDLSHPPELYVIFNKLNLILSIDPEYYYELESSSYNAIGLSVSRSQLEEHRQILSIVCVVLASAIDCLKVVSSDDWDADVDRDN